MKPYKIKDRTANTSSQDYSKLVPDMTANTRELYPEGFSNLTRKLVLSSYDFSRYAIPISQYSKPPKNNYHLN